MVVAWDLSKKNNSLLNRQHATEKLLSYHKIQTTQKKWGGKQEIKVTVDEQNISYNFFSQEHSFFHNRCSWIPIRKQATKLANPTITKQGQLPKWKARQAPSGCERPYSKKKTLPHQGLTSLRTF